MSLTANTKIQSFISDVCSKINFRAVHKEIKLELKTHLEELVEEYTREGFSENDSVNKAITQMGSADIVGQQLNMIHRPKPDWNLIALSLLLINVGLVAMYLMEKHSLATPSLLFIKSLLFALLGGAVVVGLYFFDYRRLEEHSFKIYGGTLLILAGSLLFGDRVDGQIYLSIGPVSFNLLSISPILFSIALAGIFQGWDWSQPKKLFFGLVLTIMSFLFLLNGSLATAIIYAITCITLMIASGAQPKSFLLLTGLISAIIAGLIISSPDRLAQFITLINPNRNPLGNGYLQNQLSYLINSSGFFGLGLTVTPKLPDLHTDFIFSYITYTFGWFAGVCLAALVILFILRMARIASLVKDNYARMLVIGFTTVFTIQFSWNIFMNLGLAPISGVGLPFISFGGTQLVFNVATLGIVLSIYKQRNISAKPNIV